VAKKYLYKDEHRTITQLAQMAGIEQNTMSERMRRSGYDAKKAMAMRNRKPGLMPDTGVDIRMFAKSIDRSRTYVQSRVKAGMTSQEIKSESRRCRERGGNCVKFYTWHGIEFTIRDLVKITGASPSGLYRNLVKHGIEKALIMAKSVALGCEPIIEGQTTKYKYPFPETMRLEKCFRGSIRCLNYSGCWFDNERTRCIGYM